MSDIKHTLLCVDDEINILRSLKRLLRHEEYILLTANSGQEGLNILSKHEIHLVISDQRMPQMSGIEFLTQVKLKYPDVIRIILTGYTGVDSITDAINQGHVYKFFIKPWDDQQLKIEIAKAFEQYDLLQTNKLLYQKISNQELLEEELRELSIKQKKMERACHILNQLPFPIIMVDEKKDVLFMNRLAKVSDIFDDTKTHISDIVFQNLNDNSDNKFASQSILNQKIKGKTFNIKIIPSMFKDLPCATLLLMEQHV